MRKHILTFALAALPALAACDPSGPFCEKYFECFEDDQDLDDDWVAVCQEELRSQDEALRANEEDDCHVLADAWRAYGACLAALDCNDLEDEFSDPDECEDQYDDWVDAADDAGGDCYVSTTPTGEQ